MTNPNIFLASRSKFNTSPEMSSHLGNEKSLYMVDSSKSQDSCRTDSGFLSGANLTDQNLSCDDLSTPISQKSAPEFCRTIQTDSGYLDDQFSSLSLQNKEHSSCNNLSYSDSATCSDGKIKCENILPIIAEPWERYFQQDADGDTQLHIAIIKGSVEEAANLIRLAPHPSLLDIPNKFSQTALHVAVLTHETGLVRRLVLSGADVTRVDRNGNTALHLACSGGLMDCVHSLTVPASAAEMHNASIHAPAVMHQQDLNETNYDGETCVHLAAKAGHMDILKHLTWFGADINAREYKSGRTILHYAVEKLDEELLSFLLHEAGSGLVVDTPTYAGHSAYQLAAALKSSATVALLARGAAPVEMEDDDDDHPDHNADSDSDDDEMSAMDMIRCGLENYARNAVPVQ